MSIPALSDTDFAAAIGLGRVPQSGSGPAAPIRPAAVCEGKPALCLQQVGSTPTHYCGHVWVGRSRGMQPWLYVDVMSRRPGSDVMDIEIMRARCNEHPESGQLGQPHGFDVIGKDSIRGDISDAVGAIKAWMAERQMNIDVRLEGE